MSLRLGQVRRREGAEALSFNDDTIGTIQIAADGVVEIEPIQSHEASARAQAVDWARAESARRSTLAAAVEVGVLPDLGFLDAPGAPLIAWSIGRVFVVRIERDGRVRLCVTQQSANDVLVSAGMQAALVDDPPVLAVAEAEAIDASVPRVE